MRFDWAKQGAVQAVNYFFVDVSFSYDTGHNFQKLLKNMLNTY